MKHYGRLGADSSSNSAFEAASNGVNMFEPPKIDPVAIIEQEILAQETMGKRMLNPSQAALEQFKYTADVLKRILRRIK